MHGRLLSAKDLAQMQYSQKRLVMDFYLQFFSSNLDFTSDPSQVFRFLVYLTKITFWASKSGFSYPDQNVASTFKQNRDNSDESGWGWTLWYSDTSFWIVSLSRFAFITCTPNKSFSKEIEERRWDTPADLGVTRLVFRHLAQRTVYTVLRVISYVMYSSAHRKNKDGGSCAERTEDHRNATRFSSF